MKIAIHQPNFFPWYPYFQKIEESDLFVILKEVQFEKNNFQNRFSINSEWYTMSVEKGLIPIKNKNYFNPLEDWWKIKSKLSYYKNILDLYDDCISSNLLETNYKIIKKTCNLLDIKTKIVFDYQTSLKSTERLVDICKTFNASVYLSGTSGKNYLDLKLFKNIKVEFQKNHNKIHTLEILSKKL